MKISIITVNFNNEKGLRRTIESVINQKIENLEYIIIDGGSTDGSVNVIKEYARNITYWESKQDKGIYYAMNKGLNYVTGDWVNFMNSGDLFYNDLIVKEIFDSNPESSIIYGDNVLKYQWGNIVLAPADLNKTSKYMVFGHQTVFVRSEIMKAFKFDTNFKVAADFNLFYKLFIQGYQFEYIPKCISICDCTEGVSKTNPVLIFKEDAIITGRYNLPFWKYLFFIYRFRIVVRFLFLLLIPRKFKNERIKQNILKNSLIKSIQLK
jgi:glycosyltransferase involved in cell wall biosynthesis